MLNTFLVFYDKHKQDVIAIYFYDLPILNITNHQVISVHSTNNVIKTGTKPDTLYDTTVVYLAFPSISIIHQHLAVTAERFQLFQPYHSCRQWLSL